METDLLFGRYLEEAEDRLKDLDPKRIARRMSYYGLLSRDPPCLFGMRLELFVVI